MTPRARCGIYGWGIVAPRSPDIDSFARNLEASGLEHELQRLGTAARVYLGTGIGDIDTTRRLSLELEQSQREWDRFWAAPERNRLLRRYLEDSDAVAHGLPGQPPQHPDQVPDEEERFAARGEWWHFWTTVSQELQEYLAELSEIEASAVEGEVEAGKRNLIKRKRTLNARLQRK